MLCLLAAEGNQEVSSQSLQRGEQENVDSRERTREITQANLFILQIGKHAESYMEVNVALSF